MPYSSAFDEFMRPEIFRTIFEISSEAIWTRDLKTNENGWLASKENRQKYGADHFVSFEFWLNNIHPQDKDHATTGFERAIANKNITLYEHEYRFKGSNGSYYYIHDKMKFLRHADGEAYYVVGVWQDVTEEREKQFKLEEILNTMESERERFKAISEISNAAMWEIDLVEKRIYWFAGSITLEEFNLNKEVYTLDDWASGIHEEDRIRVVHNFNSTVQTGGDKYFDTYRIRKADGSFACMIDHGTIIRDGNGKALRALGGWVDITREYEREKLLRDVLQQERNLNEELAIREEELTSTEEELRQINEQLSENLTTLAEHEFILNQSQRLAKIGSWELRIDNGQIFWSEEMYNIYGVHVAFDVTSHHETLYDKNSRKLIRDSFKSLYSDHEPLDLNLSFMTPIGYKKWVRITAYPVMEDDVLTRITGISYDITYQKEAEELLRSSEEKFSKAFNNNPDLMVITREEDLAIIDANEKVFPILGYERQEVVGHLSSEFSFFINPDDRKKFFDAYKEHGTVQIECPWRRKDGSEVHLLINSSRIEINGSTHFISAIKDISDRKLAEEQFQKAFDLSPDMMMIFRERDLVLIEANSKVFDFSGYTKEETIGKPSSQIIFWVDQVNRTAFLKNYFKNGSAFCEAMFHKKDKTQFFGMINTVRILLNGENHMLTVVRDITEKRKYEQKLIQSEANLNATINNTYLMVWSVDSKYRIITYNKVFLDYMKETYDIDVAVGKEVLSKNIENQAQAKQRWADRYDRALMGMNVKDTEILNERHFSYSLNPIVDKNRITGVSVYAEDITARVLREQELSEANKKIGELKLMALRSVMNPHFVFNALNSIQFFIAKNDRQNAINYLSTFSKLIRGILTNSVKNKINLSDELELLKHYINLEILRFENKFQVEYEIDDQLDLESIEVPSLLIQPFVENAIIHGLYNKKEKGEGVLKISILKEDDDRILFKIEDNGIGRIEAEKLKAQNFPTHKSMGALLTEERLKMLSADDRTYHKVEDLMTDNKPAGTLVKIWIPM